MVKRSKADVRKKKENSVLNDVVGTLLQRISVIGKMLEASNCPFSPSEIAFCRSAADLAGTCLARFLLPSVNESDGPLLSGIIGIAVELIDISLEQEPDSEAIPGIKNGWNEIRKPIQHFFSPAKLNSLDADMKKADGDRVAMQHVVLKVLWGLLDRVNMDAPQMSYCDCCVASLEAESLTIEAMNVYSATPFLCTMLANGIEVLANTPGVPEQVKESLLLKAPKIRSFTAHAFSDPDLATDFAMMYACAKTEVAALVRAGIVDVLEAASRTGIDKDNLEAYAASAGVGEYVEVFKIRS